MDVDDLMWFFQLAFLIHLNTSVTGLPPLEIVHFFQCWDRFYTSEYEYKNGSNAERDKKMI